MMFLQRYVHIVLDAVLGSYVKNIDPEALKISVWNGKIEVDVVELQPDGFPLPPEFRIVKGTLHQVRIDLPWSSFANQPIKVDVQDVSLLLEVCDRRPESAKPSDESDAQRAKRHTETLKRKRATLEAIEKATQLNSKTAGSTATSGAVVGANSTKQWTKSLFFKLAIKVLDNVQLNIQHIHFRLEDKVSQPSRPFAVGITLESMVIKSADARWNYTMMVRGARSPTSSSTTSFLRKKIDVNKFGLYWSLPLVPVPQLAIDDSFAFMRAMQTNFWSDDLATRTMEDARYVKLLQPSDYIIEPLTLSLKLTVNDGRAKLPITHAELCSRVIARLGTTWMVQTITAIGDKAWQDFVDGMPKLAGDRIYTLTFVFSEAWAVAREHNEEEDAVPSIDQFKDALSSCLLWSRSEVDRLEPSIVKYRDAVIHILQEKSTYIDASASVDHIDVTVQRQQYLSALGMVSFINTKRRQARYKHLRPVGIRVADDSRKWWLYAISAVMIDVRERLARIDLEEIRAKKAVRKKYKDLYIIATHGKSLPLVRELVSTEFLHLPNEEITKQFEALEVELDIQELLRLRNKARESLQKLSAISAQQKASHVHGDRPAAEVSAPVSSRLWSYTSWLYGGSGENQTQKGVKSTHGSDDDIQWSDQDTKTLFEAIDFNPEEEGERADPSPHVATADDEHHHIWYRCQFMLSKTSLRLLTNSNSAEVEAGEVCPQLAMVSLDNVDFKMLVRPKSVEVGVQLGDACVIGLTDSSSPTNARINVVRMQVREIIAHHPPSVYESMSCVKLMACERVLPLIDVNVELRSCARKEPPDSDGLSPSDISSSQDVSVSVVAQAIKCDVTVGALLQLGAFFARPSNVDLTGLRERAWRQAQNLQRYSTAQIHAALTRRSKVELLVDVISPLITVRESVSPRPINASSTRRVSMIVFLGHLRASSRSGTENVDPALGDALVALGPDTQRLDHNLYDMIDVSLSAIEGRLAYENTPWADSTELLRKTSVQIGIFVSIAANDPTIPLVKLIGGVDSVQVSLDTEVFGLLLRLLRSIGDDLNRSTLMDGADDKPASTRSAPPQYRKYASAVVESDGVASQDDEAFFSGFETESRVYSQSATPKNHPFGGFSPSITQSPARAALYRALSKIRDHDSEPRSEKEIDDSDLLKLWKRVLMLVRFRVREVVVSLKVPVAESDTLKEAKSFHVSMTDIETELDARTYDKQLRFTLGSFAIEERYPRSRSSRFLISSDDAPVSGSHENGAVKHEKLIRLKISSVDLAAPKPKDVTTWTTIRSDLDGHDMKWGTMEHTTWQDPMVTWLSIDARLRTLILNLHQDAFTDLFLFFYQPSSIKNRSNENTRTQGGSAGNIQPPIVVRRVASAPTSSEPILPPIPRPPRSGSRRGLTTKIGTWVASSLAEKVSARQRRHEVQSPDKSSSENSISTTSSAASIQLRLHVAGLSVVLHQAPEVPVTASPTTSTETVFVRLRAEGFSCCVHRHPEYLGVFAYLMSMRLTDETVPDQSLQEIVGTERDRRSSNAIVPEMVPGYIPSVLDVLEVVDQVPAIVSCAMQLYGADRIQELWHPGYSNRFTVRLKSPRMRVLYRFLHDLRSYFFEGVLLTTVMRVMFPQQVEVAWDKDFLLSSFATQHLGGTGSHLNGSSPRQNATSTSDVVSMFPLLDIRMTDAVLHIPVHRTSNEALVVRFDSFRLSNEYLLDMFSNMTNRVMAKVLLNSSLSQFKMDLNALRVVSAILVDVVDNQHQAHSRTLPDMDRRELLSQSLLGSTSFVISVDFAGGNATTIGIDFSPLHLVCNREQYAFLLRLPFQNLGEAKREDSSTVHPLVSKPGNQSSLAKDKDRLEELEEEEDEDDEREVIVTLSLPEVALEILHGQEGYQPSLGGDLSMAKTEKRAQGSICLVDISIFSASVHYGLQSRSVRVSSELMGMRIRDTRQDAPTSDRYRDVVVFNPPSVSGVATPSISIRVLHGRLDASNQQERALECSFASPYRRKRPRIGSQDTNSQSSRSLRKMSSSFFGSDTLVGFHPPRRASSVFSTRSFGLGKSPESVASSNGDENPRKSTPRSDAEQPTSMRTDLILDVEGFRVIPSNIHYDVLRFLETPSRGRWETYSRDGDSPHDDGDEAEEKDGEEDDVTADVSTKEPHYIVVALTLGKSAVLLVEDPSKSLSRAVMFSWEASVTVEFLRRSTATTDPLPNNRLQIKIDISNIQATSRLSQVNLWTSNEGKRLVEVDNGSSSSTGENDMTSGDFLKPCGLECRLDIDFASEFVRLKAAFDRVLDLRFGYLDVCSLRGAVEKIVSFPGVSVDTAPASSTTAGGMRRLSVGSSMTSASSALNQDPDGATTMSGFGTSINGDIGETSYRRARRKRDQEPVLQYGFTLVYLVSATFRGPLNVRPAVGLYSSPWRKRYLVLPYTTQERQSVQPTTFRIVPAVGSRRQVGDTIRFGDRVALQAVPSIPDGVQGQQPMEGPSSLEDVAALSICKYDQLGASGYLGPDGSAGMFETRIWKYGTSAFNSDRSAIRHKDAIVFEEVTIYRTFSKGKSFYGGNRLGTSQFDIIEHGDNTRTSTEGGGYLMFNGVGDAPIPLVVSVYTESKKRSWDGEAQTEARKVSERKKTTTGPQTGKPSAVTLWQKLKVFQFSLPGINATVVNDFHNMLLPLLHLRLSQLTLDLRGSLESRLTAMAGLQVGVQSYNSQLAVWEPLVEDFDVNFALHRRGGAVCDYCLSDRQQISLSGTKLRCDGIPLCLYGSTKTAVFAPAAARAADTKNFIYQELLHHSGSPTGTDTGDRDDDARMATTCLLVIKKGINVNISRNGVNVLLQFVDLVSRAASSAEQDAWRSRLGAFVYVDNQSGIPFMVAAHPTSASPPSSSGSVGVDVHSSEYPAPPSSLDESGDESVKLPTLSIGSEEGLAGLGVHRLAGPPTLEPNSWIDNRQLSAAMKDMMSAATSWLTVEDGARLATSIVAHEAPAGSVTSPLRRLMWLRPRSSSSSKPIPVPIGYSNRSYLHLESKSGFKEGWHGESIICETVAEQGTLVMRLRGKMQLLNHLSFPIEVVYNDKRREVLQAEAGAPHFVPIQFMDGGNMTICPILERGKLQRSGHISIGSLLRTPALSKNSSSSGFRSKHQGALTGALEVRKVLTFYWDVHPDDGKVRDSGFQDEEFGVSRPPFQLILTASRKSEKHETLITISPPIRVENLVPYPIAFRTVCTKSERDLIWVKDNAATFSGTSGIVASGHSAQVCELEIFNNRGSAGGRGTITQVPSAVALSVAIPEIGYTRYSSWTETSFIYGSEKLCTGIQLLPTAIDEDIKGYNPLHLRVEIASNERLGLESLNNLAPAVCRIYAEYWLIDRTCLSVVMRTPDGRRILPWADKHHAPVALYSSNGNSSFNHRVKIGVCPEESDEAMEIESKPFDISTVGLRGQISLRPHKRSKSGMKLPSLRRTDLSMSGGSKYSQKQFDVGVMIEQGPSIFSRTTVVTFVPRFYFINASDRFQIMIKQEGDSEANAISLEPRRGCFFHWNDSRLRSRVQVRFVCVNRECCDVLDYYDAEEELDELSGSTSTPHGLSEWSLPFEVTSVGNFVIRLHRTLTRAESFDDACYVGDEFTGNDPSHTRDIACETFGSMSLHVGVELHDPAFVVRFHEGESRTLAPENNFDFTSSQLESVDVRDFVSFKLKNECTALELFVWQVIPVNKKEDGAVSAFVYEGGDRVFPFQTMEFIPFAASTAPVLHVQVQTLLETSSSWAVSHYDDEDEDDDKSGVPIGGRIAGLSSPRVLSAFNVSLEKLHTLPVIEFSDGKSVKRLWVEVALEDATKTLRVTDVLPGSSSEHKRRRRTALLRSWKRYNASVLWYSTLLRESRHSLAVSLPRRVSGEDSADDVRAKQRKQVRFASDKESSSDGDDGDDIAQVDSTPGEESEAEAPAAQSRSPAIMVAVRVVDATHLEDLYPNETSVAGISPFLRIEMSGATACSSATRKSFRTQSSKAIFPRWVPSNHHGKKRSRGDESCVLIRSFRLSDSPAADTESNGPDQVNVEVREGNKLLFGSSLLGSGAVPLSSLLTAMRATGQSMEQAVPRVHELLVPLTPSNAVPSDQSRAMVRVQVVALVADEPVAASVTLQEAIRNHVVEAQLDRLVRCKSQLKVLLERDSVDLTLSDKTGHKPDVASPNQHIQRPSVASPNAGTVRPHASPLGMGLEPRTISASSFNTDDSMSDAGMDIPFDERVLNVVVMGVNDLQIPDSTVNGEERGRKSSSDDRKVYCTVTYHESTRSATSSVAKNTTRSASPSSQSKEDIRQRMPRFVRTHHFDRGQKLGLDLIYHSGRVVVQGVSCNGPCGKLLEDGEVCIGDTIVAVNDRSIVNLHRDASFRAIEKACAAPQLEDDSPRNLQAKTVSLSFLKQAASSFGMANASHDEEYVDVPRYEAEWNRRIEFVDSTSEPTSDRSVYAGASKDKVLIRVYLRNELSDHGLTAAQESSVVPFLYFFGDEDTMDHLDHSKEDTRFDTLLGEAWVPVPPSSRSDGVISDDDAEPPMTETLCALYAPATDATVTNDPYFTSSTARTMIGQVRLALKWEHRNSLANMKTEHQLQAYLQLEVEGVFISIVDDGNSGTQRRTPREVMSISLSARHAETGIQVSYGLISDGRHVVNTRVGHLQVDNQLLDTNYPVMVFPIRLDDTFQQDQTAATASSPLNDDTTASIPEGVKRANADMSASSRGDKMLLPTFQLMGVFSKRQTLLQFEYIFAQLQELDVKIEDAILVATAQAMSGIQWSLLSSGSESTDRKSDIENKGQGAIGEAALTLVDARWPFPNTPQFPLASLNVQHRGGNMKVLLRWLLFCPIKISVTFTSTTDRANLLSLVSPEMSSVLRTLISAAAALVSNLDNAAIKVPEFYVENLLETTHTLGFYAMQHYVHHGLRSWYRIVGSVDFLGNPIGLVSALGAGVKDFFYTPAQMLLEDEDGLRIENLRTGMTKGSKSLLRNTAVGIFHTTGKITETLGKGVALLAMDDEYNIERQRQTTRQKKKINDIGDAIAEGGKGFVGGVWDGVKGVVAAPVRGAERDGAGGFVVGIGQGVAGLFVKPAAGFLDLLTSLSRGAKSSAETIDGGYDHGDMAITRARLPRRICADGVLVAFSEREARGCAILALTSLDQTDDYVYHLDYGIEAQRGILLLTDKRIICLSARSGQKLWEVALDSSLQVDTDGVSLNIAQSKTSNRVYKIECEDETAASNFKLAVSSARLDLSATRYLLLNLEKKQEEARQNALLGVVTSGDAVNGYDENGRVDLSLLMGNLQDTMVTGITEQDLRTQPLRSVQVELCHLENKDASANVPSRAIDSLLSFSVFQILVYGGPYQWTVYRRFSEFRDLHATLEKTGHSMDALPPLPGRTFLPSTRSTVATHRQEALSIFLQAAIMHSSISGSHAMLEFLTRNAHEVRVSLPPLSPTTGTLRGTIATAAGGGGNHVGAASTSGVMRTP